MFSEMAGEFRLAIRALRAAPAATLAAWLTLALGIGSTVAVFSVANGLVLRPLPVDNPQQLVTVTSETALRHGFQAGIGWNHAMWERFRPRAGMFDGTFAWTLQRLDLSEGGEMQPVTALVASGAFFSTLGVRAAVGRTFTPADDVRGGGPDGAVAVISHDLWHRRFGGDPNVLGSRLPLEGTAVTIVGVAPPGFRGVDVARPFDLAMPFGTETLIRGRRSLMDSPRALLLTVMLRLRRGQTVTEASAALRAMQPQIVGREAPGFLKEPFVIVGASTGISDRSRLRQLYQYPLVILSIVSSVVLLIVCVNIASLFLARAAARRRELAVRLALGAPRWRLARPLFVEALVLGSAGCLAGVLLAAWAGRTLVTLLPAPDGPVLIDLQFDWRVLAFTVGVTGIAVVLFGTMPALHAARVAPVEALQDEARSTAGRRAGVLSGGLVAAQVALSVVLVAAAGLFVGTASRLAEVPLGFEPEGVLVVTVRPRPVPGGAAPVQVHQRALAAVAAVPGVLHAAGSVWTPFGTGGGRLLTDARGRRADVGGQVAFNFVTPGWFATYRAAIHTGRDFDASDDAGAPRVALINETLRRTLFHDRTGLGETIQAGPCGRDGCTVVGVVADTVYGRSLRDAPPATVFVPLAQSRGLTPPDAAFRISVRTAGEPGRLAPGLAAALRSVDSGLTFAFRPLDLDLDTSLAPERLVATLAGFFGAMALLLSAVGLYGVTAYAVARRRAEIGIRLALGGPLRAVLQATLARLGACVLAGAILGLFAAWWLSRFAAPLLYGLEPQDPVTLVSSVLVLVLVAVVAAYPPARHAARIDPAQVLREN